MTVTELIEKLRTFPQNAEIIIENTDVFINGYYTVTDVEDFDDGNVLIYTDHEELLYED